jgi:hypothetical protein
MKARLAIADRPDGLGARLCAIFNALLVSELTGADFAFTWPETYVNSDPFHAVPDARQVFSDGFVSCHCFPPASADCFAAKPLTLPPLMPLLQAREYLNKALDESNVTLPWNPLLRRIEMSPQEERDLVLRVQRRLQFSSELRDVRRRTREVALPRRATALHLRAGDIVYGRFSENPNFVGKTIPAPLAKLILDEDSAKADFVLFGQEPEFASLMTDAGKAVSAFDLLPDLNKFSLHSALKDVFLMARCKGYYAGSSGFMALADNIGRCRNLRWDRKRPKSVWARMICNEVEKQSDIYSLQQSAFSCFFAYTYFEKSDTEHRLYSIAMARSFSPTNRLYGLLQALNAYDQGLWEEAELALSEVACARGVDKCELLESRGMRRILSSKSSGGISPYQSHEHGLRRAVRHGCPSAASIFAGIYDNASH